MSADARWPVAQPNEASWSPGTGHGAAAGGAAGGELGDRLAAVLERVTDGVLAVDRAWRYAYVNAAAERQIGRRREELIGRSVWELFPEAVGLPFFDAARRAEATGEPVHVEVRYPPLDAWLEATVYPAVDGSTIVFRDVTERKRAEDGVRASEEGLRLALGAGRLGTWRFDLGAGVGTGSARTWEIFGLGRQDAITIERWTEAIHPDDRDRALMVFEQAAGGSGTFDLEYRVVRPDGQIRWVGVTGSMARDATGQPVSLDGVIADMTARKEMEEALRRSEERYRTLLDRIDQGFCVFEMLVGADGRPYDYRFLEVNPTFERHTGLKDAVGKTAREMVPGLEEHWVEIYGRVAETGVPHRFEQGSVAMGRWFAVEAVRVGGEGSRKVALLFTDVTERRRTEEALRRSEQRARLAIQAADLGTWRFDPATELVELDERMREIWGEPAAATMPLPAALERVHGDDRPRVVDAVAAALDPTTQGRYGIDFRVVWSDGEVRWVTANGQAQFEGEGSARRPVAFIGTALDITGRKRVEAALREADEDRQRLLDLVAHDLKNPLAAIKAQAQLLRRQVARRGVPEAATLSERIAGFEGLANRMTELVDELGDHARLAAGDPIELRPEPTDLVALVRDAVEEIRQTAAGHQLRLETAEGELAGVWDPGRLRRVAANLLGNAVKYSPGGGEVVVRLARADGEAVLEVRDEGIGIPAVDLPHVFDFRRRAGNVGAIAGSGIGLAGAKRIVEQHFGTIAVASEEGRGSTFTVRLPLVRRLVAVERDLAPGESWGGVSSGTEDAG